MREQIRKNYSGVWKVLGIAAAVLFLLGAPAFAAEGTAGAAAAAGAEVVSTQSAGVSAAAQSVESGASAAAQSVESGAAAAAQSAESGAAAAAQSAESGAAATVQSVASTASEPAVTEAPFDARELLKISKTSSEFWADCPVRDVELLTPNPYSRCQEAMDTVNNIVIHYVGNAGSSAMDNRNYFESLKDSKERSASSHFVIGLDGEIVQCVPISEVAYATKQRNHDTISIECCHPDSDGKFNEYTYWSLVELSAWLCKKFQLDPQEILRHYDVTGKLCPLYYVEHPEEWQTLKDTIEKRLNELKAMDLDKAA